jgi:hypothetical protein
MVLIPTTLMVPMEPKVTKLQMILKETMEPMEEIVLTITQITTLPTMVLRIIRHLMIPRATMVLTILTTLTEVTNPITMVPRVMALKMEVNQEIAQTIVMVTTASHKKVLQVKHQPMETQLLGLTKTPTKSKVVSLLLTRQ